MVVWLVGLPEVPPPPRVPRLRPHLGTLSQCAGDLKTAINQLGGDGDNPSISRTEMIHLDSWERNTAAPYILGHRLANRAKGGEAQKDLFNDMV